MRNILIMEIYIKHLGDSKEFQDFEYYMIPERDVKELKNIYEQANYELNLKLKISKNEFVEGIGEGFYNEWKKRFFFFFCRDYYGQEFIDFVDEKIENGLRRLGLDKNDLSSRSYKKTRNKILKEMVEDEIGFLITEKE